MWATAGAGIRNRKGAELTENVVSNILKNRRYLGEYRFRDIVIPNGIPRIIPEDLFNEVQEKLAKNRKAGAKHKAKEEYLLSTKLFCGKCQRMMAGESGKRQQDTVYRYYKCSGVKRKLRCDKKTVKKAWIEDLVIIEIKKIIYDDALIERIADELVAIQGEESASLKLLKNQLAEVNKYIDNLLNAIVMGVCGESTQNKMKELEERKSQLEKQIAEEAIARPIISKEQILFWLHMFKQYDTKKFEHRKKLIDVFVNAVFLYDDKMVIGFNYKSGSKTITFAELNESGIISDITCCTEPYRCNNFAP